MNNSDFPPATTRWCAGLPATSSRLLTPEELGCLARLRRSLSARAMAAACAMVLLFLLSLGIAAGLSSLAAPSHWLSAIPALLMLGIVPALFVWARACLRHSRGLREDIRRGTVTRFEGVARRMEGRRINRALSRLVSAGVFRMDSAQPQWLEALPVSGFVWQANGVRPLGWIAARFVEIADIPSFAASAAEWVEPLDYSSPDSVHINQRELSAGEKSELKRRIGRLVKRPLGVALLLNAYTGAVAALALADGHLPFGADGALFLFVVALTLAEDGALAVRLRAGAQLTRDLRLGRVMIARTPIQNPGNTPGSPALSPPTEFLPVSRICWTEAGAPATWRLLPDR